MDYTTKRDHFIRVKNSKGRFYTSVVRERYLREDITCRSELCSRCMKGDGLLTLSSDVSHYLIPDCQAALQYLDIYEHEDIRGVIFTRTCVQHIKSKIGRTQQQKFKKLLQDARQDCVVFSNVFHKDCFYDRLDGETNDQWNSRLVYEAAVWYYKHLDGKLPIVMISDNPEVRDQYNDLILNVRVISMRDYLKMFLPNHGNIFEMFVSLEAAINDNTQNQGGGVGETMKEYKEYLPIDVLETQVKLGRYIQGTLKVNKFNPKEAFVTPLSENLSKENEKLNDVMIPTLGMSYGTSTVDRVNDSSQKMWQIFRVGSIAVLRHPPKNRAVHGDHVVVETTSIYGGKDEDCSTTGTAVRTGRVIGVLQRNWREYVACFDEQETSTPGRRAGKVLVVPFDYRIPKIRISTTQIEKLKSDRIVVRIDNWRTDSMYPCGHFLRTIGPIGDLETETSVILVEHSLLTLPFTEGQLREMPRNDPEEPWVIEEHEVRKRKDLRNTHLIFSIDPKGCEDVDDTLSVRELDNGDIELGVHIADVTHFVKPNSLTDLEARARSTTVYLADRRYDMLPAVLSSDLCSLLSGVDRYAVTVLWILNKNNYEVKDVWFGKTIIRSRYKLFYEIAQIIAEDKMNKNELTKEIPELQVCTNESELNDRVDELRWTILKLMEIARKLKSTRTSQGALELEGVEVQVQLDDKTKEIEDLVPKDPLEVHETIAECMIFANHWVAKRILESFPSSSLLRRHPLPRQDKFSNVINCAKSKGFALSTSSNKALASSLDGCVDPHDETVNKIIRSLTTQAMTNALYFSTGAVSQDQYFHYGLALDRYTHFTSPIRRYADVVVHRQLMIAIHDYDDSQIVFSNQELQEVTTNMNTKHRESQYAQRDSVQLFQARYFRDLPDDDQRRFAEGVVFQTRDNGVLVLVERYGLKGPVFLKNKDDLVVSPLNLDKEGVEYVVGTIERNDLGVTVKNSCGTFRFQLFDHLKVRIVVSHSRAHGDSIKMELASCYPNKLSKSCSMSNDAIKLQKQQLVKDVKEQAEENMVKNEDEGDVSELSRLTSIYGQTNKGVSLYCLFDNFKQLALQE